MTTSIRQHSAAAPESHMRRGLRNAIRIARALLAPIAVAFACTVPTTVHAVPVLSATSGSTTYAFDVSAVHKLAIGTFSDVFRFRLDSDVSLRATSLYFASDVPNFVSELHGSSGLIASGTSIAAGDPQDDAFVNSILVPHLPGNSNYEIRISGMDLWGDFGTPYTLSLRVGPVLLAPQLAASSVPEPASVALVGLALAAMLIRGKQRRNARKSGTTP